MENNKTEDYNIIGYHPKDMTIQTKWLLSRLVEVCVRTYAETSTFEIIDIDKINSDIHSIIKKHVVCKELIVKSENIIENHVHISIIIDNIAKNCDIIPSGIITNNSDVHFE